MQVKKYCRFCNTFASQSIADFAILSTFINLPFVIGVFVLSIFEWPFYARLTVMCKTATPQKDRKLFFKTNYRLMQVKNIAECSKGEHSAILSTFIKLPFVMKIFILSIFEWFTVYQTIFVSICVCTEQHLDHFTL